MPKDNSLLQPVTLVPVTDPLDYLDAMTCACQGSQGMGTGNACQCGTVNGSGSGNS